MLTGTEAGGVESRERLPDVDVAAVEARGVEEAKQQPPTAARTPHQHQREQSTEAPSPTNWLSGANNTASSTHATMQEGGVSNAGGGGEQQQEPPPQQDAGGAALSTINGDGGSSQHAYALAPAPSPAPTSASSSSSMLPLKRPFAGAIPGDGWPRSPPALRPPLPPHQQQPLHAPAPPPGPAPAPMMFGSQQQQQQHMQQHMQQQHMQQQYIMATTPQGQVLYIAHPMVSSRSLGWGCSKSKWRGRRRFN